MFLVVWATQAVRFLREMPERILALPGWNRELGAGVFLAFLLALYTTPGDVLARLAVLTRGICAHEHVLMLAGETLPLCARNTGIFAGIASALGVLLFRHRATEWTWPSLRVRAVMLAAVGALVVDGLNSTLHGAGQPYLYTPLNVLRFGTGLVGGSMIGLAIPALHSMLSKERPRRTGVSGLRDLMWLCPLPLGIFLGVVAGVDALLFPVAFLGLAGVILAVTWINRWVCDSWRLAVIAGMGELLGLSYLKLSLLPA